ncbi:holo-ACP synthase [Streptomyces sp. NPDC049597]|uniref:holo-ACP synthase n=1 Tax=Streptomyces sp. NPDC049597 TaxID=3155276 RepID=UPI00342222B3
MSAVAELTVSVADEVARRIANPWSIPKPPRPPEALRSTGVRAVGIDVVDVTRLESLVARRGDRLVARLLTPAERGLCAGAAAGYRLNFVAGRLAAKEAVRKTLTGYGTRAGWHDVQIMRGSSGEPLPELSGRAEEAFRMAGLSRLHLSITHEGGVAVAVALASD